MHWEAILALAIAAPFVLFPVAFVWYTTGGGVYMAIKRAGERRKRTAMDMACSIDADCPQGFVCMGGRCMPQNS